MNTNDSEHAFVNAEASHTDLKHAHPCNFHLARVLDRGWGEMAFEYRWDSSSGVDGEADICAPDLAHCFLYEYTTYADNEGHYADGCFYPPDPPFVAWKFRHPTDGRSAPVACGCFAATQGWAWDRHKTGGALRVPVETAPRVYTITAWQQYRFHCNLCGLDALVPGRDAGPHSLIRSFAPYPSSSFPNTNFPNTRSEGSLLVHHAPPLWRYTFRKHQAFATMDIGSPGYVDDSKHIGFGPWESSNFEC